MSTAGAQPLTPPPGNAAPVSWDAIGRYLWISAAVVGGMLVATLIWDVLSLSYAFRTRPQKLRGFHAQLRVPLRLRILQLLHPSRSRLGRAIEACNVVFGLCMLAVYIQSSYTLSPPGPVTAGTTITTFIFCGFFAMRYLMYLALTEPGRRTKYVLGFTPLCDLVSIVGAVLPVVRAVQTTMTLTYLRAPVIYNSYTKLDSALFPGLVCTRLQRQVVRVVLAGLAFLLVFGCAVATVERAGDLWGLNKFVARPFDLWNAMFYWSVITTTTVGYGDITPQTAIGRLLTPALLLGGIVMFSLLFARVADAIQSQRAGDGAFSNPGRKLSIILTGNPDRQQLLDMLSNLYHAEHSASQSLLQTVIMLDHPRFKTEDAAFFRGHFFFRTSVTYLRGATTWLDLQRAGAHEPECQAIYVLARPGSTDDTANLLRAMAITRYLPAVPLFVMVALASSTPHLAAIGVPPERICARDKLLMGLTAANCITPGAIPLLVNLLSSETNAKAAIAMRVSPPAKPEVRPLRPRGTGKTAGPMQPAPFPDAPPVDLLQREASAASSVGRAPAPAERSFLGDSVRVGWRSMQVIGQSLFGSEMGDVAHQAQSTAGAIGKLEGLRRPLWHIEYAEGLSQEIYELAVPPWLYGLSLVQAVTVIFLSPLARLLVPSAGTDRVAPPTSIEQAVRLLESHPALTEEQAPVVLGASVGHPHAPGGPGPTFGRPASRLPQRLQIKCDLAWQRPLRQGDVLFVLLGDVSSAPTANDILESGLPTLVLGLLTDSFAPIPPLSAAAGPQGRPFRAFEAPGTPPIGSLQPFGFGSIGRPVTFARPAVSSAFRAQPPQGPLAAPTPVTLTQPATEGAEPTRVTLAHPVKEQGLPGTAGTAAPSGTEPIAVAETRVAVAPEHEAPSIATERFAWPEREAPHDHHRHGLSFRRRHAVSDTAAIAEAVPPAHAHARIAPAAEQSQGAFAQGHPAEQPAASPVEGSPHASYEGGPSPPVTGTAGRGTPGNGYSGALALAEPPRDVRGHVLVILDDSEDLESLPLFLYHLRQTSDRDVVVLSQGDPAPLVSALAELKPLNRGRRALRSSAVTGVPGRMEALHHPHHPHHPEGRLFFLQGDALRAADLRRARLHTAVRVVLFNKGAARRAAEPTIETASYETFAPQPSSLMTEGADGGSAGPELGLTGGLRAAGGAAEFDMACTVDARAVLMTVYIESRLARTNPALLAATCTEISTNSSFRLMGPVPFLRLGLQHGAKQYVPRPQFRRPTHALGDSTATEGSREAERVKSQRRLLFVPYLSTESFTEMEEAAGGGAEPRVAAGGGGSQQQHAQSPPERHESLWDRVESEMQEVVMGPVAEGHPPQAGVTRTEPTEEREEGGEDAAQVAADNLWRWRLGYKWSSRFAAGRFFPSSFINHLCAQAFFNPGLLKLVSNAKQQPHHITSGGLLLHPAHLAHPCTHVCRPTASRKETNSGCGTCPCRMRCCTHRPARALALLPCRLLGARSLPATLRLLDNLRRPYLSECPRNRFPCPDLSLAAAWTLGGSAHPARGTRTTAAASPRLHCSSESLSAQTLRRVGSPARAPQKLNAQSSQARLPPPPKATTIAGTATAKAAAGRAYSSTSCCLNKSCHWGCSGTAEASHLRYHTCTPTPPCSPAAAQVTWYLLWYQWRGKRRRRAETDRCIWLRSRVNNGQL